MQQKDVIIYGAGTMAEYSTACFELIGRKVKAYIDDAKKQKENHYLNKPLISFEFALSNFPPHMFDMFIAIGPKKLNQIRAKKIEQVKSSGYTLASIVHPSAVVWKDVILGENCIIMENATIRHGTIIEDGVLLGANLMIDHNVTIHKYCFLVYCYIGAYCQIGDYSFVGPGSTVTKGCHIGKKCLIGAGSNVFQMYRMKQQLLQKVINQAI